MRDEQQKIKGNELLVVKDLLMLQQHREERLNIVEQKLGEPGVGTGERERQQRLEERQNIVEQQWRNRHARELEEQARLLQELRDEQEKLRDEQEKIKNNEIYKDGAVCSRVCRSRERRAGKAARRARARVGSELRKIHGYVGDARWQRPRTCL